MSRLTRRLKQNVSFKRILRNDDGTAQLDNYGEYIYGPPQILKCRKEPSYERLNTGTGSSVLVGAIYFIDEKVQPEVDDLMDTDKVTAVFPYIDGAGILIGFEVHV